MIIVLIICALALGVSLYCSRNILSPAVITSGVWLLCSFLYLTLDHQLYPVSNSFKIGISLWVIFFCFFALIGESVTLVRTNNDINASFRMRRIFFFFSLITFPILLVNTYLFLQEIAYHNILHNLRNAALREGFLTQAIAFFVVVWLVTYTVELIYLSRSNRIRLIILLIINAMYALIVVSKASLFTVFFITIAVLFFKRKISAKKIGVSLLILFFVFQVIQVSRSGGFQNEYEKTPVGFASIYLLSGMSSFSTLEPKSSEYFGENVFRFFYAVSNKLKLSDTEPINIVLEFIEVPVRTNVYTTLYPFYKDFGQIGIVVFASIFGLFFGFLYKKSQENNLFFLCLYVYFAAGLSLQFMNEVFFSTFSMSLQFILISYILFIGKPIIQIKRKNG